MKKFLLVISIVIIAIASCEKSQNDKIPDGVYTGTFQRQLAFGGGEIAQITITFSSNTWTGQSDKPKYPALCHGTYKLDKQKIVFTNECAWTAEFDWSLILGGDYDFSIDGNQLEILRSSLGPSSDTWTDKYSLTRQ